MVAVVGHHLLPLKQSAPIVTMFLAIQPAQHRSLIDMLDHMTFDITMAIIGNTTIIIIISNTASIIINGSTMAQALVHPPVVALLRPAVAKVVV